MNGTVALDIHLRLLIFVLNIEKKKRVFMEEWVLEWLVRIS